jgi:hypothetical protein
MPPFGNLERPIEKAAQIAQDERLDSRGVERLDGVAALASRTRRRALPSVSCSANERAGVGSMGP